MLTFHRYIDKAGEYRWNVKAGNGRILVDSGEGYQQEAMRDRRLNAFLQMVKQEQYRIVDDPPLTVRGHPCD